MAKRIRVSTDDVTYYTLPGASGSLSTEMAQVDDTIFGQAWKSENPSIGMWEVQGNSYFKGVAGYSADVQVGGTPTATTGEATTLVSGKTYRIDTASRRVISIADTVVVYDNAVDHTADVDSIDYLNGTVTFNSGYTVTGAVTLDYSYLPMAAIGKARTFNVQQTADEIDTSDYETCQANGGWRTYKPGLRTVGLEIGNVWAAANDFITTLAARSTVYVGISPDDTAGGANEVLFRGTFKYSQQGQQGNVGALEEETLNLNLFVPSGALVQHPFSWYFEGTYAIPEAVKLCIEAWQNESTIWVEYEPETAGVGKKGQCIVTDASLANSFEDQNEFSFTLKGTGAVSAI